MVPVFPLARSRAVAGNFAHTAIPLAQIWCLGPERWGAGADFPPAKAVSPLLPAGYLVVGQAIYERISEPPWSTPPITESDVTRDKKIRSQTVEAILCKDGEHSAAASQRLGQGNGTVQ